MGAWGAGHFENDDALDFLAEVDGPQVLEATFKMLPPPGEGCIDASDASRAMAAADIVAAMKGCPSADCPEELQDRLSDFGEPGNELLALAREAVSRVLFDSELLDLWAESEDAEIWNQSVTDLIDRLNPSTGSHDGARTPKSRKRKKGENEASASLCAYCREPVGEEGVIMLTIQSIVDDQINKLDRALFCHLKCFNGKLHPRDMIQNWKVDPEDPAFKAMVDKLLRGDRA
jgi:hypothetical protein